MRYLADKQRHLICIPFSVENLHAMARVFGIKPHWFHKRIYSHYDIPKRRLTEILGDPRVEVVSPRKLLKELYADIERDIKEREEQLHLELEGVLEWPT